MLQPRLSMRSIRFSCRLTQLQFHRTYAQAVEPVVPSTNAAKADARVELARSRLRTVTHNSALRKYIPRTPGLRHLIRPINDHLWKGRPIQKLTWPKKGQAKGGRNHTGRIVMRHRGGGHKRRVRMVDFNRKEGGECNVERIEYDPGRSAHIALIKNKKTQEVSYILAADGLRAGDTVQSYRSGLPQALMDQMGGQIDLGILASQTAWKGNCLKLGMIPVGTPIFNISADKNSKGLFCRSAGTHGIIIGKGEDAVQKEMVKVIGENGDLDVTQLSPEQLLKFEKAANFVTVKLSSGEVRLIDKEAVATIGVASNINNKFRQLGKAGRSRWLGIRPTVRGLAMNAVDHPHGGGRGKSKGNRIPVSIWGVQAKSGFKTRKKNKINKMVVTERPRNHGKRRRGYS